MGIGNNLSFSGETSPSVLENRVFDQDNIAWRMTQVPSNLMERFDYDTRTDGQPVYIGFAAYGTATTADTWLIYKLTYNVSDHITAKDIAYGSWDGRVALFP